MNRVITNIGGDKHLNIEALTAWEATAISLVAVFAVTAGTIMATVLS